MGFFDFLKRNKSTPEFPTTAPASASSPPPVPSPPESAPDASHYPLAEMARFVTGNDPVAVDGPAQHPEHGAMAVIGAAVAVFAHGAAKFADHSDHGVAPGLGADFLRKARQAAP